MFSFSGLVLACITLGFVLHTNAALSIRSLYVTEPSEGSSCHGGQNCTIQWLDDGTWPLLSSFGISTVGLYTGTQQLVQNIEPVDTSTIHSLTFTPIPGAGPNSDTYYICFTSTSVFENGTAVMAFSPFFQLDQMSGSFATPLESATASIAIPTSLTQTSADSASELSTVIVGTLSTSLSPLTSLSATSPATSASSTTTSHFSTALTGSTSTSATASAVAQAGTANGALTRANTVSPLIMGVLSLCYIVVWVL
ncbi:uncharacterized protein BT62DRAFT_441043 [Guyanagaster necrorhizus]|uniref:Yeast cell wall synthesis Kre9/Knh1-like N-terminal domain-containing protein n=1 Tax=Guyanagaster necrorhizus TaxID=856835 RepID=A0A9P7W329_9AGAR|nr:uncharacterized protein BT62DRAFT_441043 [Guyanagaster necrorhizus MCA 3950]KAG7451674.1 hypothetical protein BT62DRAFT_441043 [Guyanagaster necrorhizus MCA 3950]